MLHPGPFAAAKAYLRPNDRRSAARKDPRTCPYCLKYILMFSKRTETASSKTSAVRTWVRVVWCMVRNYSIRDDFPGPPSARLRLAVLG